MPERVIPILRIVCFALAVVVIFQCSRLLAHKDPLADLKPPVRRGAAQKPAAPDPPTPTNAVPRGGMRNPGPPLPPAVQARIDRITQSEILAPVIRPLPMALLGIAGHDAFIRAPNGQTGLLREGEELGGLKLLKIGTNRVLIEHEGQQKELLMFGGLGGETLLEKETPK